MICSISDAVGRDLREAGITKAKQCCYRPMLRISAEISEMDRPVDNAAGNGRSGGITLGRAQFHDIMQRHLVRRKRHTHSPAALA